MRVSSNHAPTGNSMEYIASLEAGTGQQGGGNPASGLYYITITILLLLYYYYYITIITYLVHITTT